MRKESKKKNFFFFVGLIGENLIREKNLQEINLVREERTPRESGRLWWYLYA